MEGKRPIYGGRAEVRRMLYLAALSAVKWDPVLRDFHNQLLAAGKLKKVALIAVARKLLVHLNTQMKQFQQQNQQTTPARAPAT